MPLRPSARWSFLIALWVLGCALWGFIAWSGPVALPSWLMPTLLAKRYCAAKDERACRIACSRGVAGELGCMPAKDWGRACQLGFIPGCLEGIRAEAKKQEPKARERVTGVSFPLPSAAWVQLQDRACELGDAASCRAAGDWRLSVDDVRGLAAYERLCSLLPLPQRAACLTERRGLVTQSAPLRQACAGGEARRCSELGALLMVHHAYESALRAFQRECSLRGFEHENPFSTQREDCGLDADPPPWLEPRNPLGSCADALAAPFWRNRNGVPAEPPALPEAAAARGSVSIANATLPPGESMEAIVDATALQQAFIARLGSVEQCYRRALVQEPQLAGKLQIWLVVDRYGDATTLTANVYVREPAPTTFDPRGLAACVKQTLSPRALLAPRASILRASWLLELTPR